MQNCVGKEPHPCSRPLSVASQDPRHQDEYAGSAGLQLVKDNDGGDGSRFRRRSKAARMPKEQLPATISSLHAPALWEDEEAEHALSDRKQMHDRFGKFLVLTPRAMWLKQEVMQNRCR